MKKRPYFLILAGALVGLALFVVVVIAPAAGAQEGPDPRGFVFTSGGAFFVHVATTETVQNAVTFIDHAALNENPDAIFLATQVYNPFGADTGVYNNHAIGVFYSSGEEVWTIYNEDAGAMPVGAAFNVFIPQPGPSAIVHTSGVGNVSNNWTNVDHPDANGDLDALVFAIHNYNPGGGAGEYEYHDYNLGVWYTGASKWAVFNQDLTSTMPVDRDFNIYVPPPGQLAITHTATVSNSTVIATYLDHPLLNGNPRAIMLVTQNWNPGGQGGIFNDAAIGVWYEDQRWGIFNQDGSTMPTGASFNVLISAGRTYLPVIVGE